MEIHSVNDPIFTSYGRIVEGYDLDGLLDRLKDTPLPETGTIYCPSDSNLEDLPVFDSFSNNAFGGMEVQLGYCNGRNTKLNCLEYHRDSEFNLGIEDFILLLAKREEIKEGKLDTSLVKAFYVPKGTLVEIYATTLHYAPCQAKEDGFFHVLVALPKGTNMEKPDLQPRNQEDIYLTARNKWLLAHPESNEARNGAVLALVGENIDILNDITG